MKKKTKCYIYTRVSTAIQVDGYSLDAQKDKLRKYAEFQDMEIVGEYSEMKIAYLIQFDIINPLKKCGIKGFWNSYCCQRPLFFYAQI